MSDPRAAALAEATVYSHAPRAADGLIVCALGDFDGSTVFEAHVAAAIRSTLAPDGLRDAAWEAVKWLESGRTDQAEGDAATASRLRAALEGASDE